MISQLGYADDIIMFCIGSSFSARKRMDFLEKYKNFSGQEANKLKSCFVTGRSHSERDTVLKSIIGFSKKDLPLLYLGCPLYKGRGMRCVFSTILRKIHSKLASWKDKILSFGAKIALIKSVLIAMPLYFLSLLIPTKEAMHRRGKIISDFLWNDSLGVHKLH